MEFEILYWIQQLRTPVLDGIMTAVTFLGNGGWFWIALGTALFAVPKTRKTGAAMLISLAAGFIPVCLLYTSVLDGEFGGSQTDISMKNLEKRLEILISGQNES